MTGLAQPRFQTALSGLPGDPLFWETVLHQSDIFAYETANEGKGGPFGAQIWLVNALTNQYVLVGTENDAEDSNAVVSKGRASAHAEAENLSPEKRAGLVRFLENHRGENWEIVQVSSGESCPSCRSKQVLLADELIGKGLIDEKKFHVVFKATYGQTKRDADFNDSPYDQTMRAINILGILDRDKGFFGLEEALRSDATARRQIEAGELVYNPVSPVNGSDVPADVETFFRKAGDQPVAVIVRKDGSILSHSLDERDLTGDAINHPEKTAIVNALYCAARTLRDDEGKFESWNLEGATLYTNIGRIGPMAYAESLWYNLSGIVVLEDYTSELVDIQAQELPGLDNNDLFRQVSVDYDSAASPLTVVFNGDPEQASVAHLLWKARMAKERLANEQTARLAELGQSGGLAVSDINGGFVSLDTLVGHSRQNSHYDGKQAETAPNPQ